MYKTLNYPHLPAYVYCVLAAGVHSLSIENQSFTSVIRSIEVLLFPKKLVFRVGKKGLADRQALLQFLVVGWLVRIGNVLGFVGRINKFFLIFAVFQLYRYCIST